jgi:hypothetical protein
MTALSSAKSTVSVSNDQVRQKRNELFSRELQRQKDLIPRVEKIQVRHKKFKGQMAILNSTPGVKFVP